MHIDGGGCGEECKGPKGCQGPIRETMLRQILSTIPDDTLHDLMIDGTPLRDHATIPILMKKMRLLKKLSLYLVPTNESLLLSWGGKLELPNSIESESQEVVVTSSLPSTSSSAIESSVAGSLSSSSSTYVKEAIDSLSIGENSASLPFLTHLHFDKCPGLTGTILSKFLKKTPRLEVLILTTWYSDTNFTLSCFNQPSLRHVNKLIISGPIFSDPPNLFLNSMSLCGPHSGAFSNLVVLVLDPCDRIPMETLSLILTTCSRTLLSLSLLYGSTTFSSDLMSNIVSCIPLIPHIRYLEFAHPGLSFEFCQMLFSSLTHFTEVNHIRLSAFHRLARPDSFPDVNELQRVLHGPANDHGNGNNNNNLNGNINGNAIAHAPVTQPNMNGIQTNHSSNSITGLSDRDLLLLIPIPSTLKTLSLVGHDRLTTQGLGTFLQITRLNRIEIDSCTNILPGMESDIQSWINRGEVQIKINVDDDDDDDTDENEDENENNDDGQNDNNDYEGDDGVDENDIEEEGENLNDQVEDIDEVEERIDSAIGMTDE